MSAFQDVQDQQTASDVELSENKVEDYIIYFRGNVVGHEQEGLLMFLGLLSGYGYSENFHTNVLGQGPPGSGKSLTKNKNAKLIPSRDKYTKTEATSNALLDSIQWDVSLLAIMDEYDKINKDIVEVLKSSNPEDGGYSKDRNVENKDAKGGYAPVEVSADAIPWVVLYAPDSSKGSVNSELADRALKLYFSNDKHTRRGIGRKEFGHEDINISSEDYENDYIYETHSLSAAIRQHIRDLPTRNGYEEDDDGNDFLASRQGDTLVYVPSWVWYAVEPIFNIDEDYTNRVYGTVVNLIKASALFNHEDRDTTELEVYVDQDSEETESKDAIVVHQQDVANVLSCLPALLSTTHQLTPLKRHLLDAIDATEPMTDADGTTVTQVQEWLEDNDIPHPTRQTLKGRLDELAEEYYLNRYKSVAGPKGQADAYEKASQGALQTPRVGALQNHADRDDIELATEDCVTIDPNNPFDGCEDPIRDQSFQETVQQFDVRFSSSSKFDGDGDILQAAMGASSDEDAYSGSVSQNHDGGNPKGSEGQKQSSLTESTNGEVKEDTEYSATLDADGEPSNPTEQHVLDSVSENKGETFTQHHGVLAKMGVIDPTDDPQKADLSGTVADPDHELWQDRPDLTSDRVISQEDTLRELEQAYSSLKQEGLVEEDTERAPPAMLRLNTI